MKKILTAITMLALAATSFGQGQVKITNTQGNPVNLNGGGMMTTRTTGTFSTYYLAALLFDTGPGGSFVPVAYATNSAALAGVLAAGNQSPVPVLDQTVNFKLYVWQYQLGNAMGQAGLDALLANVDLSSPTAPKVSDGSMTGFYVGFGSGSVQPNQLGGVTAAPNIFGNGAGQLSSLTLYQTVAVPEPATFALAGLGAAALMVFRRRK